MDECYDSGYGYPSSQPSVTPDIANHVHGDVNVLRFSQHGSEMPLMDFTNLSLTVDRPIWSSSDSSVADYTPTPLTPQD